VLAEGAVLSGHGGEELAEFLGEIGWALEVRFNEAGKELAGKQADVFGEKAEEQAHEKVRGTFGRDAAIAQALGENGKLFGCTLGYIFSGLARF
jgi:hypothetical protein